MSQSPANSSAKPATSKNQPKLVLQPKLNLIADLQARGYQRIVGLDEVGRGAIAGPVVVAATELLVKIPGITDSKLVPLTLRQSLAWQIHRRATQLSIGVASATEINRLGIVGALRLAYERAIEQVEADLFLTDFIRLPGHKFISQPRGDQYFYPVAAASIVAKVYRDNLLQVYHRHFPEYGWRTNVGYGTAHHREAVKRLGPTPLHRKDFI